MQLYNFCFNGYHKYFKVYKNIFFFRMIRPYDPIQSHGSPLPPARLELRGEIDPDALLLQRLDHRCELLGGVANVLELTNKFLQLWQLQDVLDGDDHVEVAATKHG